MVYRLPSQWPWLKISVFPCPKLAILLAPSRQRRRRAYYNRKVAEFQPTKYEMLVARPTDSTTLPSASMFTHFTHILSSPPRPFSLSPHTISPTFGLPALVNFSEAVNHLQPTSFTVQTQEHFGPCIGGSEFLTFIPCCNPVLNIVHIHP
jgi:hypothetical protein